jgi:serine/threonine protein kinase
MKQADWQKIEELFNAALELPPEKRNEFLEMLCAGESEIEKEVKTLLAKAETNDGFLHKPIFSLGIALFRQEKGEAFLGEKIGRYKIVKLLGQGGMGKVYLAKDLTLNRLAALKLLPAYLVEDDGSIVRFQKEALTASAVSHPSIAHIYEAGIEENQRFIAMEYVEGITLRDLLNKQKIDVITAFDIIIQTGNALIASHQAGIIHRDIKPENIMIRPDGYIKVLDFGVAKLLTDGQSQNPSHLQNYSFKDTIPGLVMGTVNYASPEQIQGKKVDYQTDIWSLGVVLYEVLTGLKLFEKKDSRKASAKILKVKLPLASKILSESGYDDELKKILTRALMKNPKKRYQSVEEFNNDLKQLKQNLEFKRQFSSAKTSTKKILSDDTNTNEQTKSFTFLIRTRQFWKNQSPSRKALLAAGLISLLTFTIGFSAHYPSQFYPDKSQNLKPFSPDSRSRLQISNLFSTIRKPNGAIKNISFSPDSKLIAFTLFGNDSSDIYVKQVEKGEQPNKMTDGKGKNQSPIWSPDGQKLAFVSDRDNRSGIWTVPYSGGTPVFQNSLEDIKFCHLRKWSNDGKRIYYEYCKKLYTIELDSGKVSEIPLPEADIAGDFNISNDEKMMTFVAIENKKRQIFIQSLENGEMKAITKNDRHNWSPVLFPDKQRVAYSSNQNGISQIYVSDVTGSEPLPITFGDINASIPVVSPDGTKIVHVSESDEANIFSFDLKTGKESGQTSNTKMQLFPSVSSNNEKMVFQTIDNVSKIFSGILKIKPVGVEIEPSQINLIGGEPQWSPRNDSFAFLKQLSIDIDIWKTDVNDLKEKQLTVGGIVVDGIDIAPYNLTSIPFDWSPDGKKIVYSSEHSGFCNLWTIDEDGNNPQMLTRNDNNKLSLSSALWSPEGERISYVYTKQLDVKKVQYGISVLSNGETRNLFESNSSIRLLGWLPNGGEVLAAVQNKSGADLISISTISKVKPLTIVNLEGGNINGMAFSPDRRKVAYSARRNGSNNVFVFSLDGKEAQLTSNLENTLYYSGLTWSPDGTGLYYSKQSGGIQISMISDSD